MTQQEKLTILKNLRASAEAADADAKRNLDELTKQIAFQQRLITYAADVKSFATEKLQALDADIKAVTEGKL